MFYLLVLRPALRRSPDAARSINEAVAAEFRIIVETCMFVLLATGVILTFNRLTPGVVGVPYAATLAVKIALAIWMFVLARGRRRRPALMRLIQDDVTPEAPKSRLQRSRHLRDHRVPARGCAQGPVRICLGERVKHRIQGDLAHQPDCLGDDDASRRRFIRCGRIVTSLMEVDAR